MGKIKNIQPKDQNGEPHGIWKEFFSNGQLFELITYNHGSKNGLFERYHIDGTIDVRCNFFNNKRHGLYERHIYQKNIWEREYYEHGKLISKEISK